ncbi:hypothetical protein DBR42_18905 [Pelomonas sp. HMWF004]|nr:hypothetical protein DBR42_18905 [Pelomonas sp. HMWF004]
MAKAEAPAAAPQVSESDSESAAGARGRMSLEDQIAKQEQRLRELREQQREQQRKAREKNIRAVNELIKAEKLDLISADVWRDALPAIKKALGAQSGEPGESAAGGKSGKGGE